LLPDNPHVVAATCTSKHNNPEEIPCPSRAAPCLVGLAIACSAPALAQSDFPNRPIKLLVPYSAGGGTDAIARLVAQGVGERLGKTMVVENNGSAGGNVAVTQVAGAAPDGYTVLMANQGPMTVNPHLFQERQGRSADRLRSADPDRRRTAGGGGAEAIAVQFVQGLWWISPKANPGKLNYGSAGNGSASHVATLLLNHVAGLKIQHLPYPGAGPALNDLVGAQTQLMVTTMPSAIGTDRGRSGQGTGVTGKKGIAHLKDVPTSPPSAIPDYEATAWYGFVVPKGTPKDIADKLRGAIIDSIKSDLIKSRLANEGAEPSRQRRGLRRR
jgi:tripartite-type tricarboxylate transporter receptor subunit TctC